MEEWSKDEIIEKLRGAPFVARVRFSSSRDMARIDLYKRDRANCLLSAKLIDFGWKIGGLHKDMPPGIIGAFYTHYDVSDSRHKHTRKIVKRYLRSPPASVRRPPKVALPVAPASPPLPPVAKPAPKPYYDPTPSEIVVCKPRVAPIGPFRVIGVVLRNDVESDVSILGRFNTRTAAQIAANERADNMIKLIFSPSQWLGGVAWEPIPDEHWTRARDAALRHERAA
jgi:hypothetical protein